MIERERPHRRPLVPRWIPIAAVAACALVAGLVAFVAYSASWREVEVPPLVGMDEGIARARLAQASLAMDVYERPFNRAPKGTVLSQDPRAGASLKRDEAVRLVVSAGTEEFAMPDVVGFAVAVARAQLEGRGLDVRIQAVDSDQTEGTVLGTSPAPGAVVRTADLVRLTVAAKGSASAALLPFELTGLGFVIDPSGVSSGSVDAPLEVSRRLRSLLEASGARVVVTRSITSTDTSEKGRLSQARAATATAVVGLDAPASGRSGLVASALTREAAPSTAMTSSDLAEAVAAELRHSGRTVTLDTITSDAVIQGLAVPGFRLRLGSFGSPEDSAAFRDPAWADEIARSLYQAIGARFAQR